MEYFILSLSFSFIEPKSCVLHLPQATAIGAHYFNKTNISNLL